MIEENDATKKGYRYSRSNLVFFAIVFVGWVAFFVLNPPRDAYSSGERLGTIISFFLFSTLFSWIAWMISKKSRSAASIVFNVLLTLGIMGQCSTHLQRAVKTQKINALVKEKNALKNYSGDSPEEIKELETNLASYRDQVESTFDQLIETSSGREAEFYGIMRDFARDSNRALVQFETSYTAVVDERVLNFSLLQDEQEMTEQKEIIRTYTNEAAIYKDFVAGNLDRLRVALKPLGETFPQSRGAISGAQKKFDQQVPTNNQLMDKHVEYGNAMIGIIDLLEENQGNWSYEEDIVTFEDDDASEKFNALVDEITGIEAAINSLTDKMLRNL